MALYEITGYFKVEWYGKYVNWYLMAEACEKYEKNLKFLADICRKYLNWYFIVDKCRNVNWHFIVGDRDKYVAKFEVLKAAAVKVTVSWNAMPRTVADRVINNLKKPSAYPQNTGTCIPKYKVQYTTI